MSRQKRDRISLAIFGHDVETMVGVALIFVGGMLGGMGLVACIRAGKLSDLLTGFGFGWVGRAAGQNRGEYDHP